MHIIDHQSFKAHLGTSEMHPISEVMAKAISSMVSGAASMLFSNQPTAWGV
jgi:hypothetical protein